MTASPPLALHPPSVLALQELVEEQRARLQELAEAAALLGYTGETALLALVALDSRRGSVVRYMAPEYDWAPIRALGGYPVAGMVALRDGLEGLILGMDPRLAPAFRRALAPGAYLAPILLRGHAGVAEVRLRRAMRAPPPTFSLGLRHGRGRSRTS
jgi:hypothetical protein